MKPWTKARNNNKYTIFHSIIPNLHSNSHFKMWAEKWSIMKEACGSFTAPNATSGISCQAWNTPADYPAYSMWIWGPWQLVHSNNILDWKISIRYDNTCLVSCLRQLKDNTRNIHLVEITIFKFLNVCTFPKHVLEHQTVTGCLLDLNFRRCWITYIRLFTGFA